MEWAIEPAEMEDVSPTQEMTKEQMEKDGYYNIQLALDCKYRQGRHFRTLWEGYGVNKTTMEPISAFIL